MTTKSRSVLFVSIVELVLWVICYTFFPTLSMERAAIYVIDTRGIPVEGAGVTPYPFIWFGSNLTDSQGRVTVYNVGDGLTKYRIRAEGYQPLQFSFPGDRQMITLTLMQNDGGS
jgi:hypothetical protein